MVSGSAVALPMSRFGKNSPIFNGYSTAFRPEAGSLSKLYDRATATRLSRQYTEEAIEVIVDVMRNAPQDQVRLNAATALLERGYGKVVERTIDQADGLTIDQSGSVVIEILPSTKALPMSTPLAQVEPPRDEPFVEPAENENI